MSLLLVTVTRDSKTKLKFLGNLNTNGLWLNGQNNTSFKREVVLDSLIALN